MSPDRPEPVGVTVDVAVVPVGLPPGLPYTCSFLFKYGLISLKSNPKAIILLLIQYIEVLAFHVV